VVPWTGGDGNCARWQRGCDGGGRGRCDRSARQLLSELRKEVGLSADSVEGPQLLCIVEHPDTPVSDFGLGLVTELRAEASWRHISRAGMVNMSRSA